MTEPHCIFMRWRIKWSKRVDPDTGKVYCTNLAEAKRIAHKLRSSGNTLTACSYCDFVPSWDDCPVCHNRGLLIERIPPQAAPPLAHWAPVKRKQRP
jgi:hypothetical protein